MKSLLEKLFGLLAIGLLTACGSSAPLPPGPSSSGSKTLASLNLVDAYPLYTMTYYGDHASPGVSASPNGAPSAQGCTWACSLFAVLGDDDHLLFGRNFDWDFSPALLLFTHPSDGHASVSIVDVAYLGFGRDAVSRLTELSEPELEGLLDAPQIPFDGMNDQGLAIGMAAVEPGNMLPDASKPTIGSLGIIREVLDHAGDVDEAVETIERYNIAPTGGPPLHYLIADAGRRAVLVEFYRGEMHVFENDRPWHLATNFLRSSVEDAAGNCPRYDRIDRRLAETQGRLDSRSAMGLLGEVKQDSTQWSVVYQMARREVSVAMGGRYADVHRFRAADYWGSKQG